MELQRLCYTRLGKSEKNAGYQLAARSAKVDDETANSFGTKVSNIESFDGSAAESVFFSRNMVYIARLVMSMDEMSRTTTLSSALTLDGYDWRELLRSYPSWRLEMVKNPFFNRVPEGAYPGHPADVSPYLVEDAAKQRQKLSNLLSGNGTVLKLREDWFRILLRVLYHCIFATTEEPLFVSLPAGMDRAEAARVLMTAVYNAMPCAFSSQLSYCCGARLSTQIIFGDSKDCRSYANYIDLFPATYSGNGPRVNCIQASGTEFLDDMIAACTGEKSAEILDRMNRFFDELHLFDGSCIAFSQNLRGKLQYMLNAAWLSASGIAERDDRRFAYYRPGSDTVARTMLTLAAHLRQGKEYPLTEQVLAALLGVYTAWPLHEKPSERGIKLQKEAVEHELKNARAVFTAWDTPFDVAYARYLAKPLETPEGRIIFRDNAQGLLESGDPRDIHLLSQLLHDGNAVSEFSPQDWLRYRAGFLKYVRQPETRKAAEEMNAAMHKAFTGLPPQTREAVVRGMLQSKDPSLIPEFLGHQAETLVYLQGDTVTAELKSVFQRISENPALVRQLFLTENGVMDKQTPGVRKDLFKEFFSSEACTADMLQELLQRKSLCSLPDSDITDLLCTWTEHSGSWKDCIGILSQQKVQSFSDDAYTKLLGKMLANGKRASVFDGGAEEVLNSSRTAGLASQNRIDLLERYLGKCPVEHGRSALKTAAASGLDKESYQKLAEKLINKADEQQLMELLQDKSFYSDYSDDLKKTLLIMGMEHAPSLRGRIIELPVFAEISPESRLEILEKYPEEEILRKVLSDPAVRNSLLKSGLKFGENALKLCDSLYVSDGNAYNITPFYEQYLHDRRFCPAFRKAAENELDALAASGKEVPEKFFRRMLQEDKLEKDWIDLIDWYWNKHALPPAAENLDQMIGYLKGLKNYSLGESAKTYEDRILRKLLEQIHRTEDREKFLSDTEEKCASCTEVVLDALTNVFWRLFKTEDMDLSHAAFYSSEEPKAEGCKPIQKHVADASEAFCSLQKHEKPSPEGGRDLYFLATEGTLDIADDQYGELREDQRKKLLGELLAMTKSMMKSAPGKLVSSPDLTALALFGDKKKLKHSDVDKLVKWARKNGINLREKWVKPPEVIAENKKACSYYARALGHKMDRRIVRTVISLMILACVIALGAIMGPPKVESFKTWRGHHTEENIIDWVKYELADEKNPLPPELAEILAVNKDTGEYNLSGMDIDDAVLEQLVSKMDKATSLDLSSNQISDLRILATLPEIRTLKLGGNNIRDIKPLSKLTALQTLDLSGNHISDPEPLSSLTALTELNLSRNEVHDLSGLSGLISLETLDLSGNRIGNLGPLSSLAALKELNLSINEAEDLGPLSGLSSLRNLNLSGNAVLNDLYPISSMSGLTELDLSGCSSLTDLMPISGMPMLEKVLVDGSGISLREMCIFADANRNCMVVREGTPIIPVYNSDGRLYLPGNAILDLSGKPVSDLSFLRNPHGILNELQVLDLSNCGLGEAQLEDVRSIAKNLRVLVLYNNPDLSSEMLSELGDVLNFTEETEGAPEETPDNPAAGVLVLRDNAAADGADAEVFIGENREDSTETAGEETAVLALDLSGTEMIDLTGLAREYPHLRALNLSHCGLVDLTGIEGFTELEWLNLSHNNLSSLRELHRMQLYSLKWLNISFNPQLLSLEHLKNYDTLRVLYATDLSQTTESISLTNDSTKLQELRVLSVSDRISLEQADKFLTSLEVLELCAVPGEELYPESEDASIAEMYLPNIAGRDCSVTVRRYEPAEESPSDAENAAEAAESTEQSW